MIDLEAIRTGLDRREFFLEYLPTVALGDRRCVGCEALIRWRRDGRVVPPLQFIPLIENTELAGLVTDWVIEAIAQELGDWLREHEDVHISLNVPPAVLGQGGVAAAIANSNLIDVIGQLVVEVAERTVARDNNVIPFNAAARRARIAMDDTALTEASLITLSRSRIDIVKIDKPFVDQLQRQEPAAAKLAALAKLRRDGKHILVAEGVESAAQAERLQQLGVHLAQGWYFSHPLSAEHFRNYFDANR
jgi:sensor c-di-GMP phosphodiesterase-like protein